MKVGDLVRAKPGTVEGDADKLGVGIIVKEVYPEPLYGDSFVYVKWLGLEHRGEPPWMRYRCDLELIPKT
tara:strand:+ start:799 stop:1008 length:210 start_codon:yes stop_codon:yes gene_type:complete